jgi:pimeloyl-ACP methyl ester carboxylesterase
MRTILRRDVGDHNRRPARIKMNASNQRSQPLPPSWRAALEARWPLEAAAFASLAPWLGMLGRGDGHRVLVLPGYAADDRSTAPLRWAIRSNGFLADPWSLGRNVGPTWRVVTGLGERLEQLHRRDGRVSIVGWSLGGAYARALTRDRPELIRQVITLGSPYRAIEGYHPPPPAPTTSIYTRSDGITSWRLCIDPVGPRTENIEVRATHVGLGINPAVIYAVLDRLSQPEGEWRPFQPPRWAQLWYPDPASTPSHLRQPA